MRFSMLYSGEQNLSFKSCLVFYAGDSLNIKMNLGVFFFLKLIWLQSSDWIRRHSTYNQYFVCLDFAVSIIL